MSSDFVVHCWKPCAISRYAKTTLLASRGPTPIYAIGLKGLMICPLASTLPAVEPASVSLGANFLGAQYYPACSRKTS